MRRSTPLIGLTALFGIGCIPAEIDPLPDCRPRRSECPQPSTEEFHDPVRHVGRASSSTFLEPLDAVADYPLIYACTGVRALMIWDADKDDPERLVEGVASPTLGHSQFPRCQHVSLDSSAQRVAITNRGDEVQPEPWLWVFDVSNPRSPQEVAGWAPAGFPVEGVLLEGDTIYAAAHGSGLFKLRISGGQIEEVGRYRDDDTDAWAPIKDGDTLIVAEGGTGLRTYNVAGDTPELLATVPLEGASHDVVLRDGVAFVAASGSLAAVDVRDPANPVVLGEIPTVGTAVTISLGPGSTVVTAEWDAMRGYDVADPSTMTQIFSEVVPTDGEFSRVLAADVDLEANRLVAAEWRGVHHFDIDADARGPDIALSPQSLQFGDVPAGGKDDAVLVVRNQGDLPLTVHDVVSSGGASADIDCFQVDPGGAQAIEVTLEPESGGPVATSVRVCSDDPDEPTRDVTLSANVPGLDVGDDAPSFTLQDTTGATWSSADLRGNVVVLAYFATF